MKTLITPDMTDAEILAVSDDALIANVRESFRAVRRSARQMLYGIATDAELVDVHDQKPIEGVEYFIGEDGRRCIWVEKVTKFPKPRKRNKKKFKHHRNYNASATDLMVNPVGKPGSQERINEYRRRAEADEKFWSDNE